MPNSVAPRVTTTNGTKNGRTKRYADQSILWPFQVARRSRASEKGRRAARMGVAGRSAVIRRAPGLAGVQVGLPLFDQRVDRGRDARLFRPDGIHRLRHEIGGGVGVEIERGANRDLRD